MASHHVLRRNFNSGRFFAGANFFGVDTAGSKAASRLGFDGRRNFSFQKNSLSLHINVRNGNGRKQCLGIGMGRMLEKLFTRAEFHDFTQIHYHDIGGNVLDHRQIVGNEQISQGSLLLEILHQIQDLACTDTSRADTGSSHTMNLGSRARARAIPMRWRRPPSNSWG